MKLLNAATVICVLSLSGVTMTPHASAGDSNTKTVVNFDAVMEIRGPHLQGWSVVTAGTYVFNLVDSSVGGAGATGAAAKRLT